MLQGSSSPGFPAGRTAPVYEPPFQPESPSTWQYSRNFSFFVTDAAGGSGSVQASQQGHAYSPSSAYAVRSEAAASVVALLRTARLYADRPELRASFVLRDSDGRSLVSSSGLSITVSATGAQGTLTSSSCSHGSVANGVGDCSLTVSAGWFSSSEASELSVAVHVYYSSALVASGAAGNATLAMSPVHTAVTSAGLLAVLPQSPRFVGDTFVVPVTAHTNPDGGFGLKAWSVQLAWNASVLTLDSYTSSSLYASPTTNLDSAAGTMTVAVVGTQSSTALADVTGTSISLLTLTFSVSSGANRTHAPVLSATALEFLNQGNFLFVSNQQAQINDARGGAQTDGQLTVEPVAVVGHLVAFGLERARWPISQPTPLPHAFGRRGTRVPGSSPQRPCVPGRHAAWTASTA